jgi:hypothetical protein
MAVEGNAQTHEVYPLAHDSQFEECLHFVLSLCLNRKITSCPLEISFCSSLLCDADGVCRQYVGNSIPKFEVGLPPRPLYRVISQRLVNWVVHGEEPPHLRQNIDLLNETKIETGSSQVLGEMFTQIMSCITQRSMDVVPVMLEMLVCIGGQRGILSLIGMRCTIGTIECLPPQEVRTAFYRMKC